VRHRLIQPLLALAVAAAAASSALATNLVVNGDFEGGNTGFTSDYSFAPGGNTTEAQYSVRSNPYPWNSQFISAADHTSGSGLMYVGNGSPRSELVWQSASIAVTPSTDYFFEAFVMKRLLQLTARRKYLGTTSIVPEPTTPALLIAGLVSLGLAARRLRADRRGV
jgi:hypothetical protein